MATIISAISTNPSRKLAERLPFYYGWVILPIAMLAMLATSPGQTFGVSIFNPSFRSALGLSHSQLTGAYMAGTLLAALPQPFIGGLMDRFGIRRVMFFIVILFGLACIFMSQVQGLIMLFLAFFFLRLLGQGALSLLAGNSLAMWFQVRLGRVAGISNAAFAGAIAIIPPLILFLINEFGWRGAYALLGVIVWVLMLPLILFLFRNHPRDVGQLIDGRSSLTAADQAVEEKETAASFTLKEAQRTRAYWIMLALTAAWAMIATAIFFNIVPIFIDHGLTDANAAATYTTMAIALGATQLLGGWLADRFRLNWLASICMLFLVAGIVALSQANSIVIGQLYALLIGISQGLFAAVNSTVWVRYYGRAHLGRIRGTITMAMVAGSSAGPFIMGATYDLTGSYQVSLMLFTGIILPLVLAAFWATPPRERTAPV